MKVGERRSDWKLEQVLLLLRYVGLKPLSEIALKLGKNELAVASYLKRRGFRLHYVNGLKSDYFYDHFQTTKQLPFMRNVKHEIFIPWTTMEENLAFINADLMQSSVIKAMAKFQRFLHGCENNKDVVEVLWLNITE